VLLVLKVGVGDVFSVFCLRFSGVLPSTDLDSVESPFPPLWYKADPNRGRRIGVPFQPNYTDAFPLDLVFLSLLPQESPMALLRTIKRSPPGLGTPPRPRPLISASPPPRSEAFILRIDSPNRICGFRAADSFLYPSSFGA